METKDINSLLKSVARTDEGTQVIYGIYDSASQPIFTRINDFLIDHSGVPLEEKAYFFHLLAVMIDAGMPLIDALKVLAGRTKSERFRRVLNTVTFNVIQGKTLSESMSVFPQIFQDMEIGLIKSGEAAGNLDKMLLSLSEHVDKVQSLRMKLITASIYPIVVLCVLVGVVAIMVGWILPSLINVLIQGGMKESDLPLMTKVLLAVSNFITGYWWLVLIVGLILYALFKMYVQSEDGKYKWDIFKLKVPYVGELIRKTQIMRFVSSLGVLMEAGLPVVAALKIVAVSMSSELYKLKVWEIIARVQTGTKISECLMESPFLFPESVSRMMLVGEQTASIGMVSDKLAKSYETEIDNSLKSVTSILEPIMIVFVAVVVALIALAVLMPIFKLSQFVS